MRPVSTINHAPPLKTWGRQWMKIHCVPFPHNFNGWMNAVSTGKCGEVATFTTFCLSVPSHYHQRGGKCKSSSSWGSRICAWRSAHPYVVKLTVGYLQSEFSLRKFIEWAQRGRGGLWVVVGISGRKIQRWLNAAARRGPRQQFPRFSSVVTEVSSGRGRSAMPQLYAAFSFEEVVWRGSEDPAEEHSV